MSEPVDIVAENLQLKWVIQKLMLQHSSGPGGECSAEWCVKCRAIALARKLGVFDVER